MKYKIGQKVAFIGPDARNHPLIVLTRTRVPVPGKVYTIRGGRLLLAYNEVGYVLEEIVNKVGKDLISGEMMELHVPERMLRPLQERKNDGEAFVAGLRPLLNTAPRLSVFGRLRLLEENGR